MLMTRRWFGRLIFSMIVFGCLLNMGCTKATSSVDVQETGQQVGDVMASVDESGGSSGSFSSLSEVHSFNRLAAISDLSAHESNPISEDSNEVLSQSVPEPLLDQKESVAAVTTLCRSSTTFSACSSNVITRTFDGCSIGATTLAGSVVLSFSDAAVDSTCQLSSNGDSITRSPNFTLTGRRGATLTVSKSGSIGQRVTRGSSSTEYTFSNDGIRRVFTTNSGLTTYDFTTQTTQDLGITGASRSTRVMTGGTLKITNNLNSVNCSVTPTSVTWTSTCNCASSGSWSGTCSDGKSFQLTITGCGSAALTVGTESETFNFDRCYGT